MVGIVDRIKENLWILGVAAVLFVAGFLVGRSRATVARTLDQPAQAIQHASGAVTLAVNPSAAAPPPLVAAAKGTRRTRAVLVNLPPIEKPSTLQMDLTENQEGNQRVTVRLDNGAELGGVDIPTAPSGPVPRQFRHEAELSGKAGAGGIKPGGSYAYFKNGGMVGYRFQFWTNPSKGYIPDEFAAGLVIRW
jgi:hypothetical protein